MKRYEKDSLIRQIYTTFALIIAVTLVFALLFYRISFLSLRNKESRYMTNMLTQTIRKPIRANLVAAARSGPPYGSLAAPSPTPTLRFICSARPT